MRRVAALMIGLVTVLVCALAGASGAQAKTVWLCKPGEKPNPCRSSLETTVYESDGTSRVDSSERNARRPRFDCFYVYPTVSEQDSENANLEIEPQQIAIAQYQAARYSKLCDVYAPMYRQLTLKAIGGEVSDDAIRIAYSSVLSAWREYLRRHNDGRGVVLIGHSQGTGMLKELVRSEIERHPAQRRKLISAQLLGGNVTVRKGSDVGGSFRRTPVCRSSTQIGCVVAFSTFDETPPADPLFGVPEGRLSDTQGQDPSKLKVVCTNPAALGGGSAPLETLARSTPFPGTLGIGLQILYGGPQPTAPTPWLVPEDHYSGRCVRENGANVLMLSPIAGARDLNPSPSPEWGLHLLDGNIALGDQIELVAKQARAYLRGLRG
jgi:hypothetical protein